MQRTILLGLLLATAACGRDRRESQEVALGDSLSVQIDSVAEDSASTRSAVPAPDSAPTTAAKPASEPATAKPAPKPAPEPPPPPPVTAEEAAAASATVG